MTNKLPRPILAAATGVILVACRSNSSDVPSLYTEDMPLVESAAESADAALDDEAKMMAFTQCLRDQGVEVLDPVVDSQGNVQKPELAEGIAFDKETLWAAYEACDERLEGFTFERKRIDVSEMVDQYVALAACLRDKGYDVDDPTAEALEQWMGDFKKSINWDDPAAEADFEECSGDMFGESGGK